MPMPRVSPPSGTGRFWSPALAPEPPLAEQSRPIEPPPGGTVLARLRQEALRPGMVLVPARAFIGLGWLRACAEKLADSGWRDGSSLVTFLNGQMAEGIVAVPAYRQAIEGLFIPSAAALAWVIMVGQFLAGAAILVGGFTNAALIGALFMNANFLLAGEPNPSAFYVVVQAILLATQAGAVLGVDAELSATIRNPYFVAQPVGRGRLGDAGRGLLAAVALACLFVSFATLAHVADWSAAGSVHDPAMVVAILAGLGAVWAAIGWLRVDPAAPTPPLHRRRLFDLDAALAGAPLGDPRPSLVGGRRRTGGESAASPAPPTHRTRDRAGLRDEAAEVFWCEAWEREPTTEPGRSPASAALHVSVPATSPSTDRTKGGRQP